MPAGRIYYDLSLDALIRAPGRWENIINKLLNSYPLPGRSFSNLCLILIEAICLVSVTIFLDFFEKHFFWFSQSCSEAILNIVEHSLSYPYLETTQR
jgi:hypothetical protein